MERSRIGAWPGLELVGPLSGGARSSVLLARRGSAEYVVRNSTRSSGAIDWELDLQQHVAENGVRVPRLVPADDGRRHVDGVMVHERLPGRPPRDVEDWAAVIRALRVVHETTIEWPQRPGFASSGDLQTDERGGDVDLSAIPPDVVALIRRAWRAVDHGPANAIHGDLGADNVLIDDDRVGLVDWDESRVDVRWFDLAHLPSEVPVAAPVPREQIITAGVAWEAATCWIFEPAYAARRLAELRRRMSST